VPIDPLSVTRSCDLADAGYTQLRLTFEPKDLTSPCP